MSETIDKSSLKNGLISKTYKYIQTDNKIYEVDETINILNN